MLSWSSYSQQDTTKVILPTKTARLIYKDLLKYDGCKEEVKLLNDKIFKLNERETQKDTIISLLTTKDKNNQLYFGGYLTEIGRKNNELYIELVDNLTTPNIKYVLAIVNVSQLWKKIDFCLFEMLHLESHVIKPILRKLKRIDNTLYSLRR